MKLISRVAAIVALVFISTTGAVHATSSVPVIQYENQTWAVPPGNAPSQQQVRDRIVAAIQAHKRGWQVAAESPGRIEAAAVVRNKHEVRVSISYTPNGFNVVYAGSVNMNAGTGVSGNVMIHPNYNVWVGDLVRAIRDSVSRP